MGRCLMQCEALSMVHALKDLFLERLTGSDEIVRDACRLLGKGEVIVVNSIIAMKQ